MRNRALDIPIDSFIKHEKYDRDTKQNDIAVVKLSRTLEFKFPKLIRPACLWQSSEIEGTRTIATGWGDTAYAGSGSEELLKVRLDILDKSKCVSTFEDDDEIVINDNQICAGILTGGKDTCQGGQKKCATSFIFIKSN